MSTEQELIRRLFGQLKELAYGVDEVRRSSQRETAEMHILGIAARESRAVLDEASNFLMAAGYRWDGRQFLGDRPEVA
jgi:hypothetical protein